MDKTMLFVLVFTGIPITRGAVPGTFYWKPRLGLDLAIPTTEPSPSIQVPSLRNIIAGRVVFIESYQAGLTIISFAAGITSMQQMPHINPFSAYYHTNAYRWLLRHVSLLPLWLSGNGGHYCDTLKVWRRRFYYTDEFVPEWLKVFFPYVKKRSWDQEIVDHKRYKKYAVSAFGKHFRYPSKTFNFFKSYETKESSGIRETSSSE